MLPFVFVLQEMHVKSRNEKYEVLAHVHEVVIHFVSKITFFREGSFDFTNKRSFCQ